ncbi:DUF3016 domain-containing protein [Kangiella marina]|uniref:DUF3016 domain-containing protein n=1 Tax=Kangiella marina TaxID=1079178 RepID=A0ABP8IMW2_9GAMM
MKNYRSMLISAVSVLALSWAGMSAANPNDESAQSKAGIVVEWSDFDDYRDVRPATEAKGVFHKRVKKSFDKFFSEYSSELPDGQSLSIKINDLDLAGNIKLEATRSIRVMKDIDFPRMEFSYKLVGADGSVIKQGEASLKDMNYLYHEKTWKRYKEGFYYEKHMFREWFEDTIKKS